MKKQQQRADDLDDDYLLEPITDDVLGRDDDTAAETPVRASTKRSAKQADDEDAGDDRSHHQQSKQNKAQAKGKGAQSAAEQSRKKPRVDDGEQLEDAADDQADDDDDDDDEQRLATPKPADGHSYTPEELLALKRARRKRQNLKQKAKLKMRDASKDAMLQNESKSQAAVFMSELGNAYQNKLSGLELEEAQVDSTHFVDYESFKEPHTLANMCSFVKHIVPHWGAFFAVSEKQKAKVPFGAPRALILVPSALRAAEVIRYYPAASCCLGERVQSTVSECEVGGS
ncbi:hypothetical protein, variant [Capsaspora owczarzaki ATCC 30864]|uniref:Uncharacterized protein n=1 Tax=Capsaspora owczarzaki (strain ATCC 30864) TaxID=595528 RepID=A0A0D2VH23_CAPO3|nr:hypothetical protein, variant [Capsaspora owczarzaki ATCC 30864]